MPGFSISADIDVSGPVFDGRADAALRDYRNDLEQELAEQGAKMVRRNLHTVLRHPTGYYEGHIKAERFGFWQVTDSGVIYGHWLEGTGSRNAPVTRFPGYHTFEKTAGQLDREAKVIAERMLPRYVDRMN